MNSSAVKRALGSTILVGFLLTAGRSEAESDWPPRSLPGYNIFSNQQEAWLGDVLAERILFAQRLLSDLQAAAYLQALGERLAKKSKRPELAYKFFLYASDEPDAFALPGGRIYVSRGIFRLCQSEAELAAVLTHEISHVALRHGAKTISRWLFWNLGVDTVGDQEDIRTKVTQLEAYVRETDYAQPISDQVFGILRTDELLADKYGIWNLYAAGYDPSTAISLFRRYDALDRARSGEDYPLARFLQFILGSHAPAADRANFAQLEIPWMVPQANAILDSPEFRAVRAHLDSTVSKASASSP